MDSDRGMSPQRKKNAFRAGVPLETLMPERQVRANACLLGTTELDRKRCTKRFGILTFPQIDQ